MARTEESSQSLVNWKTLVPSLELLHNEQLLVNHRSELIRPLFQIMEKSLNQTEDFEQKTYIQQLCTTALLNVYAKLKSGSTRVMIEPNPPIVFHSFRSMSSRCFQ